VPVLAESLPAVTDGGRTYAFLLRRGLAYDDGRAILPSDFRHGIERVVGRGLGGYYERVRGFDACTRKRCDLSDGIEADDHAGTVVFHLTAPDPDLMYKLALPASGPVPARVGRVLREPVPATGPYKIAGIDDGRRIRLVRNPRFRPTADRPDGYPDAITIEEGVPPRSAVHTVETGQADLVTGDFGLPDELLGLLHDLATRHPERVSTSPRPTTVWGTLNARRPPFDHRDARRAVNFAVDRSAAVAGKGGEQVARATCQVLPSGLPAHHDYCPYTAGPVRDGTWRAPDLAVARRLVARSGTRGMRVTVVGPTTRFDRDARLLATTLQRIGYRVRLRLLPDKADYFTYIQDPDHDHDVQVAPVGWEADWPTPSGFLLSVFSCARPNPNNISGFCDPEADRLRRRVERLPADDPRAEGLWARIDRRITDQAAVVPLFNPLSVSFVSPRVGNLQHSRQWSTLIDQLWVK
jgi:peptide/nickel transport system substrate-binding protein